MKSFAILALLSSLVSASSGGKKTMGTSSSPTVGAAYFLTNEPSGNYIVSAAIGADGKLTLRQATPALGAGAHGGPGNGSDPLFAQGAVTASAAGNIVAAVNAGSNTISVFTIDPKDPSNLDIIGYPISSGGEFPLSVAVNKAGNTVCALTGGAVNGVACFAVDTNKRTVQPIANTARSLKLNQTTPATGPPGTASHLIFSEDNKQLIASVKGVPPTPGMLAVWDVASDGSLSPQFKAIAPPSGGVLPFGLTIIPGQNALLSADPGVGLEIFDLSSTTSKSSRASSLAIAGQAAVCWSTFSQKTGSYFVIDAGNGMVSEIALQSSTLKPTIVKQYFQGNGTTPIDAQVATVGAKDFLYVLASGATQIKVLALGTPGKATALQTVDIAGPAKRAGLTIHGPNLQGMTTFVKRA